MEAESISVPLRPPPQKKKTKENYGALPVGTACRQHPPPRPPMKPLGIPLGPNETQRESLYTFVSLILRYGS